MTLACKKQLVILKMLKQKYYFRQQSANGDKMKNQISDRRQQSFFGNELRYFENAARFSQHPV